MKRIFAVLLALILITLCSCNSFIRFDENGVSNDDGSAIADDVITIKPSNVDLPCGELSAYNKLSPPQKFLYSIMLTAISDMELGVIDVTGYSGDTFADAVIAHRAILCDRPDMFWAPKIFSYLTTESKDNCYICFKDYFAEDDGIGYYGITAEEKSVMQAELDRVLDEVTANASRYYTDFNKELYLHDYICDRVTYDKEAAKDPDVADRNSLTAYGALVNGSAICEGYSKAMQLLCIKSGIPCNVVYGENEGVSHMWNIVNPGDGEYYLDVTFDDSSATSIMHIYFNVTKKKLSKTHVFDEAFDKGKSYENSDDFNFFNVDCANTAYNYFIKTGAVITEDCESAVSAIRNAQREGKSSLEMLNMTDLSLSDAFLHLRRKARAEDIAVLNKYYRYDGENMVVVIW